MPSGWRTNRATQPTPGERASGEKHAPVLTLPLPTTMPNWPILTKFELAKLEDPAHAFGSPEVQRSLLALARARKAINDAHLSVAWARRIHHKNSPAIAEQLAACARLLAQAHADFPLLVIAGEYKRPAPRPVVGERESLPYHWEDERGNPV